MRGEVTKKLFQEEGSIQVRGSIKSSKVSKPNPIPNPNLYRLPVPIAEAGAFLASLDTDDDDGIPITDPPEGIPIADPAYMPPWNMGWDMAKEGAKGGSRALRGGMFW